MNLTIMQLNEMDINILRCLDSTFHTFMVEFGDSYGNIINCIVFLYGSLVSTELWSKDTVD